MGELYRTLMPVFIEESRENLSVILRYFKSFQSQSQGDPEALEEACRSAHTLKGTAGLVRLPQVQALAGELEAGLNRVRHSGHPLTRKNGNALLALFKELSAIVKEARATYTSSLAPAAMQAPEPPPAPFPPPRVEAAPPPEMVSAPAQEPEEEPELAPEDICCRFRAGNQDYYLPIEQMAEISLLQAIIPLPLAPVYLQGLMHLRGEVIPVIDLGSLQQPGSSSQAKQHLVIAQTGSERLAFLTDGLPMLSPEYGGLRLDLAEFIASHGVKAA